MGGLLINRKLGGSSLSAWRSLLSMAGVALGLLSPGCVPPPSPLIAEPSPPETVQPVSPQFLPRPPSAVQMVRLPSPPPQADQSLSPQTSPISHTLQGLPPPPPQTDESLSQQTAAISPASQGPSPPSRSQTGQSPSPQAAAVSPAMQGPSPLSPSQTDQSPSPQAATTKEEKSAAELALVSCLFEAVRYDDRKSDLIGVAVGLQRKCHSQFVRYIATYTRGMDLETRQKTEDKVAREELSLATSTVLRNRIIARPLNGRVGDGDDYQDSQPHP
jgi:hypothetical protein